MRRRERDAVVGPNRAGEPEFLERPLEDRERKFLLRGRQCLAGEEVAARKVGDRQGLAVPPIPQHELAFIVGAPQRVRLGRLRQRRAGRAPTPPASMDQAMAIEDRVHGADRRTVWECGQLLPQLLPDLRRPPPGILPLQPHNHRFKLRRQSIRWR